MFKNHDRRSNHVDTVHECDRQTDGRTDRITMTKSAQRIASRGKNEVERMTITEILAFEIFQMIGRSSVGRQCATLLLGTLGT